MKRSCCLSWQVLQIHNTRQNCYCKRNSDGKITQLGNNFTAFLEPCLQETIILEYSDTSANEDN